jgi:hypothetical protein
VGFNLVEVGSPSELALVPPGDKALVDVGMTGGVTPAFINTIKPYIGNPKVFGFYIADEPNPALVPASNLKAESDWIHANDPGAKTFIVLGPGPFFGYRPADIDVDLVGLDPYPIRTWGVDYSYIPEAVMAAESLGWSQAQIVPVYQAFGDAGSFVAPTLEQEEMILAIWGMLTPHPAFDYAYSWGEWGATSLVDLPDLQALFKAHNTSDPPPSPLALASYTVDRLEVDAFTWLAQFQAPYGRLAQQAQLALKANPANGTVTGLMVENQVDQLFSQWAS